MFSSLTNYKANIFLSIVEKLNLKPGFTIFVPNDLYVKFYAKSFSVSVDFLEKSPIFVDIVRNHITYDKLSYNTKQKITTLSNKSFVFNSTSKDPVIDDVRGDTFGIKLNNKVVTNQFTAYLIKGILIQDQNPFSFLEELPKDPFQHMILVGGFKGKDILQLCNLSNNIRKKCTDSLFKNLLEKLNIEINEDKSAEEIYTEFTQNPLQWMVKHHPDKDWRWYWLSENKSITLEFIKSNPSYPWEDFSSNPNITWEFVKSISEDYWDWHELSRNPAITWEIVQANPNEPWDWYFLSLNPNITWQIVQENPDEDWSWNFLSSNPNITWQIMQDNPNEHWDWDFLSGNPSITWKTVEDNLDKPWDWSTLSKNPTIDFEFVKNHPNNNWDWSALSENKAITWNIIEANPDKPWTLGGLSRNTNTTWEFVLAHPNKQWKWTALSKNPSITWENIQANLDKPWNWEELSLKENT